MPPESVWTACTYCARTKRAEQGLLPAVDRYLSDRIARLHASGPMLILSGKYGLLSPSDPSPWYDHLLMPDEVGEMARIVAIQLLERKVRAIEFHTADPATTTPIRPYVAVMKAACREVGIELSLVILEGDPD